MKYIFILLLFLAIYSVFIEPNILTIHRIILKDEALKGLKLVFASDFHIKPYERLRLKRIVKKINAQNADIVLLGGDYVSGHEKGKTLSPSGIAAELAKLQSKLGTVAVMGNHDGWQGKKEIIEEFEAVGITVLENANKDYERFSVAGVEDLQTGMPDLKKALTNAKKPVILLSHTPDIVENIMSDVTLTLAGHTHGGQIVLPLKGALTVPSKYGTKYAYGFFEDERMNVSRGLGTSILPLRFNCFPEIVVIEFE